MVTGIEGPGGWLSELTVLAMGRVPGGARRPAVTVMVMGRYEGPAWVIAGGRLYEVIAQLVSFTEYKALVTDPFDGQPMYGTEPRWIGTIDARTAADAWSISQADELVIRTEEGREGRFTVTRGGDLSSKELTIAGYGNSPFDDNAEPDPT